MQLVYLIGIFEDNIVRDRLETLFSWNKAEIIFEFCDIILYWSAYLPKFLIL